MLALPLKTERLVLRNFNPEDWERVHLYGAIPEFSQYEFWGPNSIEDSKSFAFAMSKQTEDSNRYQFDLAVCLKENGLLIGGCTIHRASMDSSIAHLGWAINPDFQNKGYATEAARALVDVGFEKWKLVLISATCDVRNISSIKVMEKLGMKKVGNFKGNKLVKGHMRDTYRYEIPTKKLLAE